MSITAMEGFYEFVKQRIFNN